MTELPFPPIPLDCDLRDFPFTPIFRARLFGSTFHARRSDAEWRAGVTLWLKSWDQMPAGSLPTDDVELARLAEFARDIKGWRKVRQGALHGWIECSDGRLYHPVVTEGVLEAYTRRRKASDKGKAGAFKRWCQDDGTGNARAMQQPSKTDSTGIAQAMARAMPSDSKGQGYRQGQGEGQGSGSDLRPSPPSSAEPLEGVDPSLPRGRKANGTNPRALGTNPRANGTNPRAHRNQSLEAWRSAIVPIERVAATGSLPSAERLTWLHVREQLQDQLALAAIEAVGEGDFGHGCRLIADRDRFNQADLEARFRTAYERVTGQAS
jgi:hypothetical protein